MRLAEKYRPRKLQDVIGQPPVTILRRLVANPYACSILLEGTGAGIGKTSAAMALAAELGCEDEYSGLVMVPASELSIDLCRRLFEHSFRLYPMNGSKGWHVLILEELETLPPAVQTYLKVMLESKMPQRLIVIATSNGAGKLSKALLQRWKIYSFQSGSWLATAAQDTLANIWSAEAGDIPMPASRFTWGWSGEDFSLRLALDQMSDALAMMEVMA